MAPDDDREQGYIQVHRKILSSRLYLSLTAEQRSVFLTLLLLANWRENRLLVSGRWAPIARGELAHSLSKIAEKAAVSVKVVRTTLARLMADDTRVGGRGPFLAERWIREADQDLAENGKSGTQPGTGPGIAAGTTAGTGLRVLIVRHYDEYQAPQESAGTAAGTAAGTRRARSGHAKGTVGAPREEGKEDHHQKDAEKGREPSRWEALADELRARRRAALPAGTPDDLQPLAPVTLNARFGAIAKAMNGAGTTDADAAIRAAWEEYLVDEWARTLTPPCPLNAFVADGVWPRQHARAQKRRIDESPPAPVPPPAPRPPRPPCTVHGCAETSAWDTSAGPLCSAHMVRWDDGGALRQPGEGLGHLITPEEIAGWLATVGSEPPPDAPRPR